MSPDLQSLAIGLGLGLLVGVQRTWSDHDEAGVRTFALITLLGVLSAILARSFGGWIVAVGLAGVAAMLVTVNLGRHRRAEKVDLGATTEVAALLMYSVGAALGAGLTVPAVVVGGVVAVLLQWKGPLHEVADRLDRAEMGAIARLVLIGLVILPILPNRDFGPFEVLNPFEIWLMVVLIVGISMVGYVAFRLFGGRGGAVVAGLLGGVISSTATTVSYSRRSRDTPARSASAALVITLASVVVFGRVMVEIAVVAPGILLDVTPPLVAMMAFMGALALLLMLRTSDEGGLELEEQDPPSELTAAVIFGALYAAVLVGVALAREYLGTGGLYVVAGLSGLTDIDAITLSTAQLMKGDGLDPATGWRVILVGALANLVFKGLVVFTIGHRSLRGRIAAVFGATLAAGGAILVFWPA